MIPSTQVFLAIAALLVLGALFFMLRAGVRRYKAFDGPGVVTCPETGEPAGVRVDAKHASLTGVLGRPVLRLEDCSRWPENRRCGQVCLDQIEAAPTACLVRTMLATWYQGKSCALCGFPFGEIRPQDFQPALVRPEGATLEWGEIPAEALPRVLATHQPVCWNCHVVETFRRAHPELVAGVRTTRPRRGAGP